MSNKKIYLAGNMIVDILYPVSGLPKPGELTSIQDGISRSTGGAVCNVIGDLALMDPALRLTALGRVGTDAEGDYILECLGAHKNIDLSMIKREGITSFTAVMADTISKERTFFHYRGANARFCEDDIDWNKIGEGLLHIGYILLLDALDEEDSEYGTKMAKLLCRAREHGLLTSLDVVSEMGDRFKRLVPPSLKYADYCIINELEAGQVTGIPLRDSAGSLLTANIPRALDEMKKFGVSRWAVIHCPEGGYGLDEKGKYFESPTINLPPDYIKGKVGAGDAFCAGTIYAASEGAGLDEGLELGNAAAAASLSQPGATEGMLPVEELKKLRSRFN
ncbi:MAG: carbohydrate kinase family protein [Acidobacteriota bacterium]|jgi:sugar/nucleoside kinase (ribokinase family)|nr:carbohydrate kinase family protein [Acidobacteriota bacterium]